MVDDWLLAVGRWLLAVGRCRPSRRHTSHVRETNISKLKRLNDVMFFTLCETQRTTMTVFRFQPLRYSPTLLQLGNGIAEILDGGKQEDIDDDVGDKQCRRHRGIVAHHAAGTDDQYENDNCVAQEVAERRGSENLAVKAGADACETGILLTLAEVDIVDGGCSLYLLERVKGLLGGSGQLAANLLEMTTLSFQTTAHGEQ